MPNMHKSQTGGPSLQVRIGARKGLSLDTYMAMRHAAIDEQKSLGELLEEAWAGRPQHDLYAEVARLRGVLERIKAESGRVCDEYETCTHIACASSHHAWEIADAALSGETPESANAKALAQR
jgi:hypothetical protein